MRPKWRAFSHPLSDRSMEEHDLFQYRSTSTLTDFYVILGDHCFEMWFVIVYNKELDLTGYFFTCKFTRSPYRSCDTSTHTFSDLRWIANLTNVGQLERYGTIFAQYRLCILLLYSFRGAIFLLYRFHSAIGFTSVRLSHIITFAWLLRIAPTVDRDLHSGDAFENSNSVQRQPAINSAGSGVWFFQAE